MADELDELLVVLVLPGRELYRAKIERAEGRIAICIGLRIPRRSEDVQPPDDRCSHLCVVVFACGLVAFGNVFDLLVTTPKRIGLFPLTKWIAISPEGSCIFELRGNDLEALKFAGLSAAPPNTPILDYYSPDFVTTRKSGHAAFRNLADLILSSQKIKIKY